jgi:excisionase family DNA binding protein
MSTDPVLLTSSEAAQALKVTRHTIGEWTRSGRMRFARRVPGPRGGTYLYTAGEVARVAALPRPRRGRKPAHA